MTDGTRRRYPILYSVQRWNDGKWFYGGFFIILVVLIVIKVIQHQSIISFIPVTVLDGLIVVAVSDDGIEIRYLLHHIALPYTALARVRRQPLEVAFQPAERRRLVNRFVRRLARGPAAYIRLDRRQSDLIESAERQLGARMVAGADIVIPVADVDDFVTHIKGRLRGQST
jgi:hypothetical protein